MTTARTVLESSEQGKRFAIRLARVGSGFKVVFVLAVDLDGLESICLPLTRAQTRVLIDELTREYDASFQPRSQWVTE